MSEIESRIKKVYCNICNNMTKHELKYENRNYTKEDVGNTYIEWEDANLVWECRGCEEITVEKTEVFSEDVGPNGPILYSSYLPERNHDLMKFKKYKNIPVKLEQLYNELIRSFNNSSFLVCSIGARALIEGILVDKGFNNGKLKQKIDAAGFIPKNIRDNLHGFRFLGNSAAHELTVPDKDDLQTALLVIEDILNLSYELDYRSKIILERFKGETS